MWASLPIWNEDCMRLKIDISKNSNSSVKKWFLTANEKQYRPFELIYSEEAATSREARVREKFLKSGKGRAFIKSCDLSCRPAQDMTE